MVKVKDLPDLTSNKIHPEPFLMCTGECGCTFSANSGDYFLYPKEHVFTCCGDPMSLMTKRVVYEEWEPIGEKHMIKLFRVHVSWTTVAEYVVEANSLEEAKEKVYDLPLSDAKNPEYLDDSFEIDEDLTNSSNPDGEPFQTLK